jgi:putative flippase GtrA
MIATGKPAAIIQHKGVRQFVKFGIVGASSTVVNFGIFNLLLNRVPLLAALTAGFVLSVCNGFYWNRRWTFKEARSNSVHDQYAKFLAVNAIAWCLDTSIVVVIVAHFTGHGLLTDPQAFKQILVAIVTGQGRSDYGRGLVNGALASATCVIVFWNYFANRLWTFKN